MRVRIYYQYPTYIESQGTMCLSPEDSLESVIKRWEAVFMKELRIMRMKSNEEGPYLDPLITCMVTLREYANYHFEGRDDIFLVLVPK